MSIIETMTKRNGVRKDPPPMPALPQQFSPVVAKHIEHVTNIEEQLRDCMETMRSMGLENEQLRRELAIERRERAAAQAERAEFHTRAIASETAVNNAAAILIDEVKRGREFAAQRAAPETTGNSETPVDLDKMAANINAEVRSES